MDSLPTVSTLEDGDCFLETKEAARFIGISPATLATWRRKDYRGPRRKDGPPYHRLANNTVVYLKSELLAWVLKYRGGPTIAPAKPGEPPRPWETR